MKKYIPLMKNSSLFAGMKDSEIEGILTCLNAGKAEFAKGEYILRAGSITDSMGLLLEGSVLIIQEDIWGRRSIIDKVLPGEFFAESFATSEKVLLNVSVVAENPCTILMLNAGKILSVCSASCVHHTKLIRNLVTILANKSLRLNNKITHMSRRSTKEKLMSFLSSEAIRSNSMSFTIPYDRQQLADYLCVERAAMSVALSALKKEGLLSYNKNRFVLHAKARELF